MITLNQITGYNNEVIWVFRLFGESSTTYFSTRDINLTNNYDGKVLSLSTPISNVIWSSTIQQSGGAGTVSNYQITISRYVDNSDLAGFFNEFYPATSGSQLTSRPIDMGIVWEGASSDTDITWLFRGRVIEYYYNQRSIELTIFQESEVTNKEIPYYSVQKDFDNDVSYFTIAPDDSYGTPIPIVYGSFDINIQLSGYVLRTPAIAVGQKDNTFLVCAHKVYESTDDAYSLEYVYKYIGDLECYETIQNSDSAKSSTTNNNTRYSVSLIYERGGYLKGFLNIRLIGLSQDSDVDVEKCIDRDLTNYDDLDANIAGNNRLALKCIGSASTSDVGILSPNGNAIKLYYRISTDGGGDRNYTLNYVNNTLSSPLGALIPATGTLTSGTPTSQNLWFGADTNGKTESTLPWTIEEITALDFEIENNQTTPGEKIRVYYGWIEISSIRVYAIGTRVRALRNSTGGRNA